MKFKSTCIRVKQLETINKLEKESEQGDVHGRDCWTQVMWLFYCGHLIKQTTQFTNMEAFRRDCEKSQRLLYGLLLTLMFLLPNYQIEAHVTNKTRLMIPAHFYRGSKYTIDDLINGKFSYRVSDDIDMDPCKASTYPSTPISLLKSFYIFYLVCNSRVAAKRG